jgi:aspartate carbamoyltransferase catalytic subunit
MSTHDPARPAPPGAGPFDSPGAPRHLLGLEGLPKTELLALLEAAGRFRALLETKQPLPRELEGVSVANCFFEDSTRTRFSFELAEQHLGARLVSFSSAGSSMSKGETLRDTARVIAAMGVDLVVVRHPMSGAPHFLTSELRSGVINAGDGMHEHPTQGLLDLLTLRRAWGARFEGRRIAIVGDIAHSRVARSACHGLRTLGVEVIVAGPATLMPEAVEILGVTVAGTVEEALEGADAVMALRVQRERMEKGLLPSLGEYRRAWGLDANRAKRMKAEAPILHPGPVNRGVELDPDVADSPRSLILDQVSNGVAVRCAVLRRCAAALTEEVA